jgi:hypothetical protein
MAQPNQYTLASEHTRITYSTTSINGQPQLHFHDRQATVNVSGQEIRIHDTEIGTQVTVTIHVTAINNTRLTLLIPHVELPEKAPSVAIKTIAILTTTQTEGIPPVRQTYQVVRLRGTARLVQS